LRELLVGARRAGGKTACLEHRSRFRKRALMRVAPANELLGAARVLERQLLRALSVQNGAARTARRRRKSRAPPLDKLINLIQLASTGTGIILLSNANAPPSVNCQSKVNKRHCMQFDLRADLAVAQYDVFDCSPRVIQKNQREEQIDRFSI
jgi:hypothetical protein